MQLAPSPPGGAAAAVFGAAQPGDQSALPGGHQPDSAEGLCAALSVPSGKERLTCREEGDEVASTSWNDDNDVNDSFDIVDSGCDDDKVVTSWNDDDIVICSDDDIVVPSHYVNIVITSWYDNDDDITITSNKISTTSENNDSDDFNYVSTYWYDNDDIDFTSCNDDDTYFLE